MNNYFVYEHISPSGKHYIGITCRKRPEWRWGVDGKKYLTIDKNNNYHQPAFANAILKYGWDNFEHNILFHGCSKELACKLERAFIKYYKELGMSYNISDGGEGGAHKRFTEEELRKHRKEYESKYNAEHKEARRQYYLDHIEKIREYNKSDARKATYEKYKAAHEDEIKARSKKWNQEHPEAVRERSRKYEAKHRAERNARLREYYRTHKEDYKRRARERQERLKSSTK